MTLNYRAEVLHTKKLYHDFAKFTYKMKSPATLIRICILIVGFIMLGVSFVRAKQMVLGAICLGLGGVLLLCTIFRAWLSSIRMARHNESYQKKQPVIFEFSNMDFTIGTGENVEKASYNKVSDIYADDIYFYLWLNEEIVHVIPKKDFTEGKPEEFAKYIETKTKKKIKEIKREKRTAKSAAS